MCCAWGSRFGSCKTGCRWLGAEGLNGVSQLSEVLRGRGGHDEKNPGDETMAGAEAGWGAGRWAS